MISADPTITCGYCGKDSPVDLWCRTPISGELPRDQFQCPACNRAFRVVPNPDAKPWKPGRKIVEVGAVL